MKDYEAKELAEDYYKRWLNIPKKDYEDGGSIVSAIKYALIQDRKNRKKNDKKPK